MKRLFPTSLRARLLILVLAALLPASGLMVYTASEQKQFAAAAMQENALRLVRPASSHYDRLVEGTRQLLMVLARLPEVQKGDANQTHALFADLLFHYPLYSNLGTIDPHGRLIAEAVVSSEGPNLENRPFFQRALMTRDFAVGNFDRARRSDKAAIDFGYPVFDVKGKIRGVVFAALDLAWLNQYAKEAELPRGSILTMIDRRGTVLVHYPDSSRWVGRSLSGSPAIPETLAKRAGVTASVDPDGVTRLYAFAPLGETAGGAFLSIGIPRDIAFAPANSILARNLVVLWVIGIAMLFATWIWGSFRILSRINALVEAANRLSGGDLSARSGLKFAPDEIGRLAQAFDDMADSIEAVQNQLVESEEEKDRFFREVILAVTHGKLHLVDASEIPVEGRLLLELPLENPMDDHDLRRQLRNIAKTEGMAPEGVGDLLLAAGEAATNAIKHASGGCCAIFAASNRLIVRVSDVGVGILTENLPATLLQRGFSTKVSLGMGYTLMLKLVDEVWLATGPMGTTVQLEKWFHPEERPEPSLFAAWERM